MGAANSIATVSSYSYSSSIQDSKNITQYNSEVLCDAKCDDNISNVFLTIENSNVGNITFNQECSATVDCYQKNDIEIINNIQMTNTQVSEATADNDVKAPFLGVSNSYADITSEAKNYSLASSYIATYININMACISTSLNNISDVVITIKDTTTGNIEFVQKGSATTSCQSINSAKVSNSVTLVNDQTAISESSNSVGGFSIGGLIALLIIAAIILAAIKVLGNKSGQQPQSCTPEPGKPLPAGCPPPPPPLGFYPPIPGQYPPAFPSTGGPQLSQSPLVNQPQQKATNPLIGAEGLKK